MILDILKAVAAEDKTTVKEQILMSNKDNNALMLCFKFAYNKQITFGVNRKTIPGYNRSSADDVTLDAMLSWLEQALASRAMTGHAAINALALMLGRMLPDDAEVIRRVLMRDLEVGIGQTVAEKVWPGICPKQPQMLASAQDDDLVEKILARGNAFAELKADGARCFADLEARSESVSFSSRNGNEYQLLSHIEQALLSSGYGNWVVDGELVYRGKKNPVGLAALMGDTVEDVADREEGNGIVNKSLAGSISQEEALGIVYQVWDIVPRDVYYGERACPEELTQERRREILLEMLARIDDEFAHCVEVIESTPVKTLEEANAVYQKYVKMKYEGIILKCGNALWKDTRSKDCVKFKQKIRVDLRIVGAYPHKKDPNKLGGFNLRSECGMIEVNVGSGFSDTTKVKEKNIYTKKMEWRDVPLSERMENDRELLWSIRHKLIDSMIVEIECNDLQVSKSRKVGDAIFSLFLPTFKLFRHDKSVANHIADVFPDYKEKLKN